MKIVTVRRICQIFFAVLFIWFCLVTTLGDGWWQLRGWPVNWLIQLDPLVGLGTLLATHRLYQGTDLGTRHPSPEPGVGPGVLRLDLSFRGPPSSWWATWEAGDGPWPAGFSVTGPIPVQRLKYGILIFLLAAAAGDMAGFLMAGVYARPVWGVPGVILLCVGILLAAFRGRRFLSRAGAVTAVAVFAGVILIQGRLPINQWLATSLQTGLLDPIPLMQRSVSLVLLPLLDNPLNVLAPVPRVYQGAGLIGLLFLAVLVIGFRVPRFYCRFICPTGALLGLLSRWAWWRVGRQTDECRDCRQCESHCEGACSPTEKIATHECVLCFNCIDHCRHGVMGFSASPPGDGRRSAPDWGRREIMDIGGGRAGRGPHAAAVGSRRHQPPSSCHPSAGRPGGAPVSATLHQMRPVHAALSHPGHSAGPVSGRLWKGCGPRCSTFAWGPAGASPIAWPAARICPTAAIRPLSLDETHGGAAPTGIPDRCAPAPPSWIAAGACPGPWTPPASSARRTVR